VAIVEWNVVPVVVMRRVPLMGVLREGNFVTTTKLEMAELKGLGFGLKMKSVAAGRTALKIEGKKAEIAAKITGWETADLLQGPVAEGRERKVVDVPAGIAESK
jgi:hypothetical protein